MIRRIHLTVGVVAVGACLAGCGGGTSQSTLVAFRGDGGNLYVAEPSGAHVRLITSSANSAPSWSPDGRRIAFSVSAGVEKSELRVVTADGTPQPKLLHHEPPGLGDVVWAPDGEHVIAHVAGTPYDGDIAVIDIPSGRMRRITSGPADDKTPQVSADGAWIAFRRDTDAGAAIWIVRPDGSGLRQVVPPATLAAHPWWSPDGSELVFNNATGSVTPGAGKSHIFVVARDGSHLRRLTGAAGTTDFHPSWGADGTIYFTRYVFAPTSRPFALFRMSADGSGVTQLPLGDIPGDLNDATTNKR